MPRRANWFEIGLAVLFLSATLFGAFSDAYNLPNTWFIRDDAYYYFKVAQNISEGRGSTFDGIHPTNGYHPLWLAICIPIFALARFDLILPLRILAIVIGMLQFGTAILLYRLVRVTVSEPAAVLAACFWAFNTYVLLFLYKTGVESSITIFLVLLLLHALHRLEMQWRNREPSLRQLAGLGALSVLITFGRLDLAFFALVVGIWAIFRGSPVRYFLPLDALAIVVATVAAFLARLGFTAYYDVTDSVIIMMAAALICKVPVLYLFGLYRKPTTHGLPRYVGLLALSVVAGSVLLAVILVGGSALGAVPAFSRAVLFIDTGITFGLLLSIRLGATLFSVHAAPSVSPSPLQMLKENWRRWLKEGAAFYGVIGGSLAAYMLWNRLAFGTPTPVSGQIKQWWGTFTHSIYGTSAGSWLTFFAVNPFSDFNAWAPLTTRLSDWSNRWLYIEGTGFGSPRWQENFVVVLLLSALVLLAIPLLGRRPAVRAVVQTGMVPLFVGSWLQILAYNVTGYASAKEWYWLLEPVLIVLLAAVLLRVITGLVVPKLPAARYALWVLVAWYGITTGTAYWRDAYALNPYGVHPPGTAYTPVIPFLEANTEHGALIGMTGGGNVGYLMPGRTIVNMDGLINSTQYFQAMQAGTGSDYLYDTGLRYIFANPTILAANPYKGQYNGRLELLVDWGGKDLLRLLPREGN